MNVVVRAGVPADADGLAVAHVRAWQEGYRGLMPQEYLDGLEVAERLTGWQERLANPREGSRLLVGTVDEQVAGFAVFGAARDPDSGEDGELFAINVHPDHWRAGVGSRLLVEVHTGLADLGHENAVLWVVAGNDRARRFYERHGWSVEAVERSDKLPGLTVPEVRYARRLVEEEVK
jgi:ribosomal protein S18 acetylase RimI-like enzyme